MIIRRCFFFFVDFYLLLHIVVFCAGFSAVAVTVTICAYMHSACSKSSSNIFRIAQIKSFNSQSVELACWIQAQ